MPSVTEKDLERRIIGVLERYYTEKDVLTIAGASEDAGIERVDVVHYMIENKLYPETEDPIREECLAKVALLKDKIDFYSYLN